jgi:predicted 3-demethylubiquinone-9 3-methyltransferase (glyoxalase superfamily)
MDKPRGGPSIVLPRCKDLPRPGAYLRFLGAFARRLRRQSARRRRLQQVVAARIVQATMAFCPTRLAQAMPKAQRAATQEHPATPDPVPVRDVLPCLTFDGRCAEALELYTSTFRYSRIVSMVRHPEHPAGKDAVLHAEFELKGTRLTAMDGGPGFSFSPGFSLAVTVDTQEELDAVWARLAEGGEEQPCGWLRDRFGVSWQIVPSALPRMMERPDRGDAKSLVDAMLRMRKLDIARLQAAYEGRTSEAERPERADAPGRTA